MLFLTQKQLEQIREYIAAFGIRTTDFPDTPTVTANDWLAIVQDGTNKKIKVSDLFDPELLPSLIVDINVVDEWGPTTTSDHTSALSAALGKELYDAVGNIQPTTIYDGLDSIRTDWALSANQGRILASMINERLTVINDLYSTSTTSALSANQGRVLREMIEAISVGLTQESGYYDLIVGNTTVPIYSKGQVDDLISGISPSPVGSIALSDLTDVDDDLDPENGNALVYDGTKWVAGTVSGQDTWRPITVVTNDGNVSIGSSSTLKFTSGTGIRLSVSETSGVAQLTITNTGGGTTGGDDYFIGRTQAGTVTNKGQALEGVGLLELVGVSGSDNPKIYFGDTEVSTSGVPFIEWDSTNGCFHFSHGLYSDDFISAAGYNNQGGGGGGASYLYDLTDVNKVGTAVGRADGVTGAQNNDVLTYSSSVGKWVAAPAQGGGGGGSTVLWGQTSSDSVALSVDGVSKTLLTAHQSLSGYLTTSSTLQWSKVSGFPDRSLTIGTKTYKPTGGGDVTVVVGDLGLKALTFGTSGRSFNCTSDLTMNISDITNVINSESVPYVQIGQIKIQYDSSNNALKVIGATGSSANFISTGAVVAGSSN